MNNEDKIVKIFTGSTVDVNFVTRYLLDNGVPSIIKDKYSESVHAGFVTGLPDTIDIFIINKDKEKAIQLMNDYYDSIPKDN